MADVQAGAPLSTLLADPTLGLTLLVGAAERRFVNVRWADREPDRYWLEPGDLRLTSGPDARPEQLLRAEPAAVVYAPTPQSRRLPEGLAGRAEEAGVALLVAPPAVAPERVAVAALRALAAAGGAAAALTAPQAYLLAALDSPKPERDLLERLNALMGGDLVLVSPWGEVVARAGSGGWRPQSGTPLAGWAEGPARLDGREVLLYRVTAAGRLRSVLLAFGAPAAARPWLELTRTLLVVAATLGEADARAAAARREGILALWLAAPEAPELAGLLADHGLAPATAYRVAAADLGPAAQAAPLELALAAGDDYLGQRAVPALSGVREGRVVWLYAAAPGAAASAADHHAPALLAALEATLGDGAAPRLGLSRITEGLAAAATAYRQALAALSSAAPGDVAAYDDADPVELLLDQRPEQLAALREKVLGRLLANDDQGKLMSTLHAYLDARGDAAELARALGVHPNTLRYRLKRIEELVGAPLARPETIARLWLATRQEAMGGPP